MPLPDALCRGLQERGVPSSYRRKLLASEGGGGHLHTVWGLARDIIEDPLGGSPFAIAGSDAAQLAAIERLSLYLLLSLPFINAAGQAGIKAPGAF